MSSHPDSRAAIAELLREAGRVHREALGRGQELNQAWAAWYADYLVGRLGALLRTQLDAPTLARELAEAEAERRREDPGGEQSTYYAAWLVRRHGH